MAHSVFLSYSQKDRKAADAVCAALEANGLRVWIAPRDIPPGATWPESIPAAIDAARVMVLIFSDSANSSKHIAREIDIACDRKLTIIPVRIANVALSGALRYYLGTSQWFDAFPGPIEPHLGRLVATVRKSIGAPPESARAPQAKPAAPAHDPAPMRKPQRLIGAGAAPARSRLWLLAAAAGAAAVLGGVGIAVFSGRDAAPGLPAVPPGPAQVEADCTRLVPPCSDAADAHEPPLPGGGEITGFATVLSANALQIKDRRIELANVAPAPASSAAKLRDWIEAFGNSVRCRPAPRSGGKYFCDVGPTHIDLATQVLRQGWARPGAAAPTGAPPY